MVGHMVGDNIVVMCVICFSEQNLEKPEINAIQCLQGQSNSYGHNCRLKVSSREGQIDALREME